MSQAHIILGLWPVAGITTVGVTKSDARETMAAAIESGITNFDTAFSYGHDGDSDRLLGEFIRADRDRFAVIGKVGQRWTEQRERVVDGSPETLTADAETSLRRMGMDQFDVLMLHSPDPRVPIESSAQAIAGLQRRGLCKRMGVCNVDAAEYRRFAEAAPCDAIQCPLNLMQRASLQELIPQCARDQRDVYVFWTLMKGLLAGRISRGHVFAEGDSRPNYEIFQGRARRRAHDILDDMKEIAASSGLTIAQMSIGWTLSQRGVTAALVGARRAEQVKEIAAARPLAADMVKGIDRVVDAHSPAT